MSSTLPTPATSAAAAGGHTQGQMDHHANQMNPNSAAFKSAADHHANQSNPNSAAYAAVQSNKASQQSGQAGGKHSGGKHK